MHLIRWRDYTFCILQKSGRRPMKEELKQGFAKGGRAKIKRDAFLYIGPKERHKTGQCSSCFLWIKSREICEIHEPSIDIRGTDSCGFYIHGDPISSWSIKALGLVTPEESGLVRRQTRCENCRFAQNGATVCGLFTMLNNCYSDFDLDTKIEPQGCCNAQMP
jgi:hypothetical protein